ncbi:unnamed protein product [Rotaria sp. Silwood2]|nr:unnamed protein product [Rotaria sp. Silwood2]CAF4076204.1 unnamed protein product [Rotaria sp. Silwood2]
MDILYVDQSARTFFYLLLRLDYLIPSICVLLMGLLGWDMMQSWRELDHHGIIWFCTGLEYLPNWNPGKISDDRMPPPSTLFDKKSIGTLNTDYSHVFNTANKRLHKTDMVTINRQVSSLSIESSDNNERDYQADKNASPEVMVTSVNIKEEFQSLL